MKTTVEIEPALFKAAKRAAVDRDCTLRTLIENGLRRELEAAPTARRKVRWVTASGTLPAELDLSDREAMWRWIEADPGEHK